MRPCRLACACWQCLASECNIVRVRVLVPAMLQHLPLVALKKAAMARSAALGAARTPHTVARLVAAYKRHAHNSRHQCRLYGGAEAI